MDGGFYSLNVRNYYTISFLASPDGYSRFSVPDNDNIHGENEMKLILSLGSIYS
jgi:hypothetical protein